MADDPAILTPPRSVAFDAVAGIRSGMEGFRRAWPILFVGGCMKGCTEGGATGNPGGATQLGDAGSGGAMPRWDWDPRTLGITAAVAVTPSILITSSLAIPTFKVFHSVLSLSTHFTYVFCFFVREYRHRI